MIYWISSSIKLNNTFPSIFFADSVFAFLFWFLSNSHRCVLTCSAFDSFWLKRNVVFLIFLILLFYVLQFKVMIRVTPSLPTCFSHWNKFFCLPSLLFVSKWRKWRTHFSKLYSKSWSYISEATIVIQC